MILTLHLKMMVVKIMSEHVDCFHEEQIQGQSRKIAELETRANYKEKMIDKLNENMKDIKETIESLDKTINNFILKSINDDGKLKEIINKQDNRITALETANKTLKWVIGIGFSALASVIAVLSFLIANLH